MARSSEKYVKKIFFPAEFFFSLPGAPETSIYFFVALNTNLFVFGKTDTIPCSVCNIEHETTLHLLANCTKTNIFWANIKRVFQKKFKTCFTDSTECHVWFSRCQLRYIFSFKYYFIFI